MLRPIKHMRPAMEAIAFQSGAFFKELKMLFEPYCNTGKAPSKSDLASLAGQLDRAIHNHVGVNAAIQFEYTGSCMYPPDIATNNILLGEWRNFFRSHTGISLIAKEGTEQILGGVDLKKSKLSGFLSKIPVTIVMDISQFHVDNMTPGEYAAILLHEIGHYFSYCEMLTRTITTNQILAGVEQVMRKGDTKEYLIALKKAGKELDIEDTVIENLKDSTDEKVVLTVLATESARAPRTANANSAYDAVSWEMASDQFATRHGAGRDIATALDKIFVRYGYNARRTKTVHYIVQVYKVLKVVALLISATVLAIGGDLLHTLTALFSVGMLLLDSVDYGIQGTYDKPQQRINRIRQQLIESIKDPDIPKQLSQELLADIKVLDGLISEYTNHEAWLALAMRKLFAPIGRKYDNVKFQQELEALAANSLFASAVELKHA
jgi:hypothetical protein